MTFCRAVIWNRIAVAPLLESRLRGSTVPTPPRGPQLYITLAIHTYSTEVRVQVLGPDSWGSTPACATLSKRFLFDL